MNFKNFESFINEALNISEIRPYILKWEKSGGRDRYKEWFGDKWRVYIDLVSDKSDTQLDVEELLDDNGYQVVDYYTNKAKKIGDERNVFKIGRLITRFADKGSDLASRFANDKDAIKADSEYKVVISRHPYDIVGMTTERRWHEMSCMNSRTGSNRHYLEKDILHGTLVAYLVRNDDMNINDPVNRVLMKPYVNGDNRVLGTENKVYFGRNDKEIVGFKDTVDSWLHQKQGDITKKHWIDDNVYNDGRVSVEPTDKVVQKLKRKYIVLQMYNNQYHITDRKTGLQGSADSNGNIIIEPKYKKLELNSSKYAVAALEGLSSYGLIITATGEHATDFKYEKIGHVNVDNEIAFKLLCDIHGNVELFYRNKIIGTYGDVRGFNGNFIVTPEIDLLEVLNSDNADKKWGIIDSEANVIIPCEYDRITDWDDGIILVEKDGKKGFFTKNSDELALPCEYDNISPLINNSIYTIVKDNKYGILEIAPNKIMSILIPCEYDNINMDMNRFAFVLSKNKKYTLLDKSLNIIAVNISTNIYHVSKISNDVYAIGTMTKTGLAKNGKLILPIEYSRLYKIKEPFVYIQNDKGSGIYNIETNKFIVPIQYQRIGRFGNYFIASNGSKRFDSVYSEEDDEVSCLYDLNGMMIYDLIFNEVHFEQDEVRLFSYEQRKVVCISRSSNEIIENPY
jgi:hypothetical protein